MVMTVSALAIMLAFPPTYLVSGALGNGLWFYGGLIALFYQAISVVLSLIAIPRIGGRVQGACPAQNSDTLGRISIPVDYRQRIILKAVNK